MRARTGAGGRGFRMLPNGTFMVTGRKLPSLNGTSLPSSTPLMQLMTADWVEASGELMLRLTCPQVPSKSISIVSPAIVTAACTHSGLPLPSMSSPASAPR